MEKKKVVIALGHKALGKTLPEQKKAAQYSASIIADLIQEGCLLVITHSNAPQVGMIHTAMNEFGNHHEDYTMAPMSVCSAMSQGYIGYDLQNAIRAELLNRGIFKTVTTLLTQVRVDPYDDSFYHPIKTIGRPLNAEEAALEEEKGNYVAKVEDGMYRRIIASPKPQEIIELDSIKTLLDAGHVVIACGGGGIPVLTQGAELKGASAVIEKDLTSGVLAKDIDADCLMILTSVEHVALNYGKENEEALSNISVDEVKKYMKEGHFDPTSMLPKVEASINFLESKKDGKAIITSIDMARQAYLGKTGTVIQN